MAKRYSGDLTIVLAYDDRGFYPTAISRGRRRIWRGQIGAPASGFGRGVAYDSSRAFDDIARSALSFADHDGADVASSAESLPDGWQIRRTTSRRPRTK